MRESLPPDSPSRAALLPAAAFALALVLGLVAGVASLSRAPAQAWKGIDEPESVASGESGARVSRLLNDHFALRDAFHRVERGVSWVLLGDLGPRVRGGCPGWLFLKDELEIHPDPAGAAAMRAELAARAGERLAARGAKLLLVIVPDKSRIEREHLCGLRRPARFEGRVAGWVADLEARGVSALDLAPALAGQPGERYYRTDSHWNEEGARASAQAIAGRLRAQGLAQAVPAPGPLAAERVPRRGDLVRVAGLDGLPDGIGPGVEIVQRYAVPAPAAASDDLFGDAGVPKVAVVGSSYSRSANFVPFLARELGEPVVNAAREGADFDGAARAYLEGATFRDTPPRIVVWEVPERAIGIPPKPAERQWLESLAGGPARKGPSP